MTTRAVCVKLNEQSEQDLSIVLPEYTNLSEALRTALRELAKQHIRRQQRQARQARQEQHDTTGEQTRAAF
jgi:Arc/MetJ-type ribon-helix-helix transcriptional regulator